MLGCRIVSSLFVWRAIVGPKVFFFLAKCYGLNAELWPLLVWLGGFLPAYLGVSGIACKAYFHVVCCSSLNFGVQL